MIALVKSLHICALMVWCATLLMLPSIYARRNRARGEELHQLHRLARTLFIAIMSPAACLAIIAGTMLVFMRDVFTVWMAFKFLAVGVLTALHVRQGYVLLNVFGRGGHYARWRQWLATAVTAGVIGAILWLVLAKPVIDAHPLPAWLEPGGLQSLLETMMPIP